MSMSAVSSTSTGLTSTSSQSALSTVSSNTSSDATSQSLKDVDFINVAEKDLGTTSNKSRDDGDKTTDGNKDSYQRQSAQHGSMTFVVDLGNKNVDEKAAAKLEWLQRRSIQRGADRNGSSDDITQEKVSTSKCSFPTKDYRIYNYYSKYHYSYYQL